MSIKLASKLACLALVAAAAISVVPAAEAVPVNYDFTVNVTTGPLKHTVDKGSFSYDSSSVMAGGFNVARNLLTSFNFSFNGTTFDAASANTGSLGFDRAGNLSSFFISSDLGLFSNNFSITDTRKDGFFYVTARFPFRHGVGNVNYARVPEPGALGMFGFGLLLLGGIATKRRSALRRFQ